MDDLTPITRLEYDLDGIVNNHSLLDPITRVEMYLSDIAAGRTASLSPITRIEMYLAKISGASVEVPAPITRVEMYLAAIAGEDVETPDPITRVEYWLDQWADQSGSGVITTVTGTSPLALANALDKSIRKLIQYGKVTTSNGDTYCNNGKLVAVDDELSVVGTAEVLTIGEQTASVENLLAVDNIKDEQNIISGTVTRRCEAVISDGTTPSGRYIGEVGDGNIIVKARESGYEGDVATFEADRAEPLNGLTVNVEPVQAGSGDPSPDNVRPISGRTSATVTRTGINIFDKSEVVDNAYINENDGTERSANGSKCTGWISVVPGEKYYILTEQTAGAWGSWYDRNKSFISPITGYLPSGSQKEQTAPSNAAYMRLTCVRNGSGNIDTFSVNYPSTDYDYHPYQGNTYTIQLGDTVYGGQLDVTQGKMVVDRAIVDLGTLTWQSGWGGFYSSDVIVPTQGDAQNRIVCSHYPVFARQVNIPDHSISLIYGGEGYASNGCIYVKDTDYDNASAFKSAMSGVQLCYELATPLEITLTPTQIETLLGQNNVWSDAGSVKAYVADAELIEHVTAQPMRTAEGSNTVSVTSAVAPVQLSATYTRAET